MHVVNCVPVSVDKGPILTSLKGKGTRLAFSSSCSSLVMRSLRYKRTWTEREAHVTPRLWFVIRVLSAIVQQGHNACLVWRAK